MILLFQSSFRLSEKNEKDKKRKEFLFWTLSVASRRPVRTHFPDRPAIAEPRLQVRNAQAPTRIRRCAMLSYGKPRGWNFGKSMGANIAK